ncbi:hypothetical protein GCM10028773_47960 [Spirosoma koreense]
MVYATASASPGSATVTASGDYGCAYNLSSRSRILGRNDLGVSFINTSSGQNATCSAAGSTYPLGAVLALNTSNRSSIAVSWTAGTITPGDGNGTAANPRVWGLQLQYRIGTTGAFTNLAGGLYTSSTTAGSAQNFSSLALPSVLNNLPVVQLRWVYYEMAPGNGGTRPEIRLDEVNVTSQPVQVLPTLTANPTALTGFTATQGTASATQAYTLSGSNLAGDVAVSAPAGSEISTDGASFSTTATFTPTSGTLSQPLFARLSAGAPAGSFNGTITHTSSGTLVANVALSGTVSTPAAGQIEITEYMYNGSEYIELTNIGNAPVDMTGWSFDDSSRQPGSFPIGSLGVVAPGESVLISESSAAAFRTNWFLPVTVKVVGGNTNNLGGSDEINIYDNNNNLIDRLTYSSGGNPTANGVSAYPTVTNLSSTTAATWQLSAVGDAQNTYTSVDGNIGNPGGYNIPLNRVLVRESLNSTTVVEGGATDTYTVALNSAPSADVTIAINSPGSPLNVAPASLLFTPANYSTAQTVTVSATDDATVQGTRSVTVTQNATSTDAAYNGIAVNPVTVQLSDPPATQPVSISATSNGPFVSLPINGPAYVGGVIDDPTDPASTAGLNFALSAIADLTVTASSSNTAVVPNANLVLSGTDANRTLKITPTDVGYATITLAASSSSAVGTYIINYAASAASVVSASSRFHTGVSDASTAIPIDANYMLVGDDENQTIRLYDRTKSGLPLNSFDFNSALGLSGNGEVDIEASTRTGNTIYWLGSHSEGGASNRQRIFSTTVNGSGAATTLTFGGYYASLRTDLVNWDTSNGHGLGAGALGLTGSAATGVDPETPAGFNIEGFTLGPDGTTGYVGFRAPLQSTTDRTKALIIPITNLATLVSGTPASGPATFGVPIFLDLGGRSIRSIERNANNEYIIIGGPIGSSTTFALFTWTGNPADAPVLRNADLTGLSTGGSFETIVEVPTGLTDTTPIQLVTDNGSTVWYADGTASKDLSQNNFQKFRSDVVLLGAAMASTLTANPTTLSSLTATQGTPSVAQSYTLSASNLTSLITVTAPTGVAVSSDNVTFASSLTLAQSTTSALVYARLTGAAVGAVTGTIINLSGSASTSVTVTGTVSASTTPSGPVYHNLATGVFQQDWTNADLITTNDTWTNVPSLIGYRGDDLTTSTGTDPQTIVADGSTTPVNVLANQTNPNTLTSGGIAEFAITNPTVALQGSGTADAPHLVVFLNTTGVTSATVAYNLRDIDGSTDNAVQPVALQYRVGTTGNYTNIPAAFVADATTGPSAATLVTPVSITLPVAALNQPQVQLRIITTNAVGNDEWVGVDDLVITGSTTGTTPPTLSATPTTLAGAQGPAYLAGSGPASVSLAVSGSNLDPASGTVTVTTSNATVFAVSSDNVSFGASATLPYSNSALTSVPVYVQLVAGQSIGNYTGTITLTGGGTVLNVPVSGTVLSNGGVTRIHDIQGTTHISSLRNQAVSNVPGIVTAVKNNGFYMQEADANVDNNDATSEGILVFTSSAPTVAVGDAVTVSGTVTEFRTNSNNASNLTVTEITGPTVTRLSVNNPLPSVTILGTGGRSIPASVIEDDVVGGNIETGTSTFDPATDGIDFYESLEGMRVQINSPVTVSPSETNGSVWLLADDGANATGRTARGGILISPNDFNPERIQIFGGLASLTSLANLNVGTKLSTIVGIVDYFDNYEVLPIATPTVTMPSSLTKEETALNPTMSQLTVATFNVENLAPTDGATKFNNLASRIVNNLKSPDIITLEEIQDNNGTGTSGVVDASTTYQMLINAVASAGGPTYQYRQIDPVFGQDGGAPGGNIRQGFFFNPNRVSFVDRPGGTSTSATTVANVAGVPQLSYSPGRIDPTNSAWTSSRKPLVGEFTFNGQTVFVIGNHFNSKGGDQPLYGPNQPPVLSSETQRVQQASIVRNFVSSILAIEPDANVVVLGDLNDFQFSTPLTILKGSGPSSLTTLVETLAPNEQYTYNFDGNAQVLDHILVSSGLHQRLDGYDVVHINSEFADQDSDHDPSVARFNLVPTPDLTAVMYARPSTVTGSTDVTTVIDVFEINSVPTSGPITLRISKDANLDLNFDASQTTIGGRAVQNGAWSFSGPAGGFYTLTSSQIIPAGGSLSVGLTGVLNPAQTTGILSLSATVIGGGELQADNNTDADKIEYFQQ